MENRSGAFVVHLRTTASGKRSGDAQTKRRTPRIADGAVRYGDQAHGGPRRRQGAALNRIRGFDHATAVAEATKCIHQLIVRRRLVVTRRNRDGRGVLQR